MAGMVIKNKPPAGSAKLGKARGKRTDTRADKAKQAPIKFSATIASVEIKSRGAKVGLLIPASEMTQVSQLIQSKLPNTFLHIVAIVKHVPVVKKVRAKKVRRGVRRSRMGVYKD